MGSEAFRRGFVIPLVAVCAALASHAYGQNHGGPVLQLRAGDLNLKRGAESQSPTGRHPARAGKRIVQFNGPLTSEQRETLRRMGVVLGDYLPQSAYVIDVGEDGVGELAELEFVHFVGRFRREWKLDPALTAIAGDVFNGALPAGARDPAALQRYKQDLSDKRVALLNDGAVQVVISSFRGTKAGDAAAELSAVAGLRILATVETGDRIAMDAFVPLDSLAAVAELPLVQFVEDAPRGALRNSVSSAVVQSGVSGETPVWDHSLHGEGEIIGLIDGAPKFSHCMFFDTEPIGPAHRKVVGSRPNPPPAPNSHGTHVAGTLVGDDEPYGEYNGRDGVAFAARMTFSDFFDVLDSPSTFFARLVDAHNDEARVHSNSWGNDGTTSYTIWSSQADEFSYSNEEDLICFAVTNQATLRSPENAKNVLAVGASEQFPDHDHHCFGGQGPTPDGRRKPDIYAPGCSIQSASSSTSCGTRSASGTSHACPAVAAAAALARQYFLEGFYPNGAAAAGDTLTPSGALLRAILLNGAVDMTAVSGYPSDLEGWGRLVLDRALHFDGERRGTIVRDVRNTDGLMTGGTGSFTFTVWGDEEDLRVTMVFTDPPASVGASHPVVNDLDLVVTGPSDGIAGGSVFRGNYFKRGQSLAGGTADPLNNVEQVHLPVPALGVYTIDVLATQVNSPAPQGYAMVVTGQVIEGSHALGSDFADSDADGDTDLADFGVLQTCYGGDGRAYLDPLCAVFDSDGDADVDAADFAVFRQLITGPVASPAP